MLEGFEAHLKLIVDNSIVGVYLVQNDRFWYVNPALARMFGYEPGELIEKLGPLDLVHPEDREFVGDRVKARLQGEEDYSHYTFRGIRKDGTTVYCEVHSSAIYYRGSLAIVGTLIDISERVRAEEAQRRSEERYKVLVDNAQDMICTLSPDGVIETLNPAFELHTGWPLSNWIGKHFSNLVYPQDFPIFANLFEKVLKGEFSYTLDIRIHRESGYGVYEFSLAPLIQEGVVEGVLAIARDVTHRKEAEENLKWELAVNSIISEVALQLLSGASLKEVGSRLLKRVAELTESRHGFLSTINPETGDDLWFLLMGVEGEECSAYVSEAGIAFSRGEDGRYRGLWGHALNTAKPFFTNVPYTHKARGGTPSWHIPLRRFIAVPAVAGGEVLGQIALANSARDYTQRDIEALKRIANLYSLALLRNREAKALKASEEKYRSLISDVIETSDVGLFILDADFKVVWVNRAIERFFGVKREELLGKDKRELVRKKLKNIFENPDEFEQQVISSYVEGGHIRNFECHVLPGPGREERWLEHWSQPISTGSYAGGRVEHYYDITRRRKAEVDLAESEERYKALVESSLTGVFIVQDQKYVFVNERFAQMHGYTPRELVGMDHLQLVHPHDREKAEKELLEILQGVASVKDYEARRITKDGKTIWCEVLVTRIDYGGRPALLGNIYDITRKKSLENQLIQSQKMEAVGRLTAGIAHDFNNMISAIGGFTELSMMALEEGTRIYGNLERVLDAANRAANLIRKLLIFSRNHPMDKRPVDLNRLVKELIKVMDQFIGEDIEIVLDLDSQLCALEGDPGSIEQALTNLLINARDAMPQGGTITIKTRVIREVSEGAVGKPERESGWVCLTVADTGVGMDREILSHIFEPFFTTKGPEEGTGLGLSVVYGVVEEHGGWIEVDSEPGKGSVFKVYFPALAVERVESMATTPRVPFEVEGHGEKVLLVEDNDHLRGFVKEALSKHGYLVLEAAGVQEALALFEREGRDFNLVFTDVVLPDGTGLQLVEELLSYKPGMGVLLTSGYTDRKSQWPVIKGRGFRFIQKPFSVEELLKATKAALGEN